MGSGVSVRDSVSRSRTQGARPAGQGPDRSTRASLFSRLFSDHVNPAPDSEIWKPALFTAAIQGPGRLPSPSRTTYSRHRRRSRRCVPVLDGNMRRASSETTGRTALARPTTGRAGSPERRTSCSPSGRGAPRSPRGRRRAAHRARAAEAVRAGSAGCPRGRRAPRPGRAGQERRVSRMQLVVVRGRLVDQQDEIDG